MDAHHNTLLITVIVAVVFGVYILIFAHRLKIPAIVPLLIGGWILGPEVIGLIDTNSINDELPTLISLAVAIILFEGGLSLDPKGYKSEKGVIRKLLVVGVLTTWLFTALLVHLIIGLPIAQSLLAGSMVVVTGPTVITPLLKRIHLKTKLHHILHYEGVLGDPIGVFLALLCLEWLMAQSAEGGGAIAIVWFLQRFLLGTILGVLGGFYCDFALRHLKIPEDLSNVFMLGSILALFGICEWILPETGLLAVTLCGLILGVKQPPYLKKIKLFQVELTDLSIACLFILLAAKLEVAGFARMGTAGFWLVVGVMFLVRPLAILLSTIREDIEWKERLMLMWMAPRGIIAASMASLVGVKLIEKELAGQEFIPSFVFAVIGATVIIQGFSAGLVAKLLGLNRPRPSSWLIIGAHTFGQSIARFLQRNQIRVYLIDANTNNVEQARRQGFKAYKADAFDAELLNWETFLDVGNVLLLTDNKDINMGLSKHWSNLHDRVRTFYWSNQDGDEYGVRDKKAKMVFSDLGKPSKISSQIESGLLQLERESGADPSKNIELLSCKAGTVRVNEKTVDPLGSEEGAQKLIYRKPKEMVTQLLSTRHILFLHEVDSIREAFVRVLKLFEDECPDISTNNLIKKFDMEFEDRPVMLEHGCSISLVYNSQIREPLVGLVRTKSALVDESSGKEVQIFLFMISPESDKTKHLKLLASIARFLSNENNRKGLLDAKAPEEVVVTLRRFDQHSEIPNL